MCSGAEGALRRGRADGCVVPVAPGATVAVHLLSPEVVTNAASTVLGASIGFVTSWYFFLRGTARSRVSVCLSEVASIDPSTVGVAVDMKIGAIRISNLRVLELSLHNKGPGDVDVLDAGDETRQDLRPRIELPPGLRVVADPWNPRRSTPRADVRAARRLNGDVQEVHVHVHRLAVGETSRLRILCTWLGEAAAPPDVVGSARFVPGFLANVDLLPAGLLRKAGAGPRTRAPRQLLRRPAP